MRWRTDKAAQLNPDVEDARSMLECEDFLFGRDRVALERVAKGLLDLHHGRCFYCKESIGRGCEIDHFVPWSYSGDDGLDNLVAACRNSKRARPWRGQITSRRYSSETISGTATSLRSRASVAGREIGRGLCASREPPTSTHRTSDHCGCIRTSGTTSKRSAPTASSWRTSSGSTHRPAATTLRTQSGTSARQMVSQLA
jgi:hypothetical protein